MSEEVIIRMGLDQSAVARGLRNVSRTVSDWAGGIKRSFEDAFHHLAAPLSVAGLVATLDKVGDMVQRIRATAAATGVSTDFLQDIENVGKAAGLAGEQVDAMIERLVRAVPPGSDVEQSFYHMADELGGIKDPALRAQRAIELFGRSGVDMLKIMEGGSAGVKELAGEFAKLSDAEMESVERANRQIEQASNALTIYVGKAVHGITTLSAALIAWGTTGASMKDIGAFLGDYEKRHEDDGKLARAQQNQANAAAAAREALAKYNRHLDDLTLKSGTASEKLGVLNNRLADAQDSLSKAGSAPEYYTALEKVADLMQQIHDTQADADKAHADALEAAQRKIEQQKRDAYEVSRAQEQVDIASTNANNARQDRSRFSLQDLASDQIGRFTTPDAARQIVGARQVEMLEARGRYLASLGYTDQSQDLFGRADKIRGGLSMLTEHERTPFQDMDRSLKQANEHWQELLRRAEQEGLKIIPAMGK